MDVRFEYWPPAPTPLAPGLQGARSLAIQIIILCVPRRNKVWKPALAHCLALAESWGWQPPFLDDLGLTTNSAVHHLCFRDSGATASQRAPKDHAWASGELRVQRHTDAQKGKQTLRRQDGRDATRFSQSIWAASAVSAYNYFKAEV